MILPDEDAETVERLMQWLYFRSLSLTKDVCSESAEDERYWQLARLNTLADKFGVGSLKNAIIDEMFARNENQDAYLPSVPVVAYIYENTTNKSPLRKLFVAWFVWHIDYDWYTSSDIPETLEEVPMFAADLAIAMSLKMKDPSLESPFCSQPSSYYENHSKILGD